MLIPNFFLNYNSHIKYITLIFLNKYIKFTTWKRGPTHLVLLRILINNHQKNSSNTRLSRIIKKLYSTFEFNKKNQSSL